MVSLKLVPIEYGDQYSLQRQALFLYDLLKERPPEANISHRDLPAFYQHLTFINSRPYAVWNIIEVCGEPVGSIYLTRGDGPGFLGDEIGIFVSKRAHRTGIGRQAIKMFMEQNPRAKYYANISPRNEASLKFFDGLGFKCIQHTYAMEAA
jgi:RimJ/RimL family protein N-acetyltransferase